VVARRNRTAPLALLLLAGAALHAFAQSPPTGSLAGKLTDLRSKPLAGATVILRNQATGAELRTTTARNGAWRFAGIPPGQYSIQAESAQLGQGSLQDIEVDPGTEARIQAAMQFEPVPAAPPQILAARPAPPIAPAPPMPLSARTAPAPQAPPVLSASLPAGLPTQPLHSLALAVPQPLRPAPALPHTVVSTDAPPPAANPPAGPPPSAPPAPPVETARAAPPAISVAPAVSPLAEILQASIISRGLAMSEVGTAGLLAALQFNSPPTSPIESASQQPAPAAQAVTTTISADELQSLPVTGRHWQEFLLDTPAASAQSGGASQPSLRGSVNQAPDSSIDGMSTELAFGASASNASRSSIAEGETGDEPSSMGRAWAGGRGAGVSESAIRQVQTVAGNVEAKDSRSAGGRVDIETRSGTNQLHGQGFLFDRQNTWGAQNPYTQWVKETAPATTSVPTFTAESYTPPDHETVWGLGAGGRIRRGQSSGRGGLFWFGALDSYHRNDPGLAMVKHPDQFFAQPSNDQMQVLSARLALSSANPVAEGLSAYSTMLGTLASLLGPAPRTSAQWVGFGRLDWQPAERHHIVLEGIGASWNAPGGGLSRVSESYGSHSFGSSQASQQWLLGHWEAYLTPNLLATTEVSAGRTILTAHPDTPSAFEQTLNHNVWGQLPQMVVDSRYGFTIGNPSRFGQGSYPDERLFRAREMVDWVHNSLLLKSGFELGHNADSVSLLRNQTGTYYYSSVYNFASDALAFADYGLSDSLDADNPHNCDQTGKVWRDSGGNLRGLGNLPCYSYYSQMMGPSNWHLSTNDWAGFASAQWQPSHLVVFSAGLRWAREQLPPPIAPLANSELPQTGKLPSLGNEWAPRFSLAFGAPETRWPTLRFGYGLYYGRTENATLLTALTQTGSPKGDLSFFMRPADDLPNNGGGAPPFPYVLAGEPLSVVKPGAVQFAPNFRNAEVHQAVAALEESLPGHIHVTAGALLSLGRRLPVTVDTNLDSPTATQTITYNVCDQVPSGTGNTSCGHLGLGPIKATQITVPFYAAWSGTPSPCPYYTPSGLNLPGRPCPNYQQISEIASRANSTYEAGVLRIARYGRRGLTFHANYTYAHAMDWNPNESTRLGGSSLLDPSDYGLEYGTSNLDLRHSAAVMLVYETPWKLHALAGRLANGWMLSGIGQFHSGLPYTMRTSGSIPEEFTTSGSVIEGLAPGINGSGGDNRVYGIGNDGIAYNIGRNTFRYPSTWKADLRLGKTFNFGHMRELEILAESFNLFNHQNITQIETTGYYIERGSSTSPPTLNYLTGLKINTVTGLPDPAFGQPLSIDATSFYRERQIELGLRMKF
jgi:Carboxypeptidase regulatory-like domain